MKKLSLLLISLISLAFLPNVYAANAKIGVIDFQKISASPKVISAQKSLQKKFAPKWATLNEKQKELNDMVAKLKRDETIMRDSDKKALQNKIQKAQQELASLSEDFKKKFAQSQQVLGQNFMDDLKKAVADVAIKNQLDFVIPKDLILYAKNQVDITGQVEKKLK